MSQPFPVRAADPAPDTLDYLLRRRSVSLKDMGGPGPDRTQIDTILSAAMRVPDHGRLFPWHFIVFSGEDRARAGSLLRDAWLAEEPDAAPAKLELEAARFTRAPVVVAVVSRIREGKPPAWEQILSAGAACHSLCLAANTLGFGANWLTEWCAYSPAFKRALGLDARDNIAGFIYIGTPLRAPEERDRPDPSAVTTHWAPGIALNKGESYGHPGKGLPRAGFDYQPAPQPKPRTG